VLPDDVTIHGIRRTVADALFNRIGTPPWIVDHVVLGHARPKLLRTYMPTLPLKEAREALQKWGGGDREDPGWGCERARAGALAAARWCEVVQSGVSSIRA
jgi:hypothetical protein